MINGNPCEKSEKSFGKVTLPTSMAPITGQSIFKFVISIRAAEVETFIALSA